MSTMNTMSTVVVESGVDIMRSPADVFDYCSDHTHEPEWNPMMTHIQQLTPGPIGVGTRYRAQFVTGPPMVIECVRYEFPSAWAMVGESPRLTARFGGHVQPTQDGAHLDMHMEIDLHGALRLATPLLRRREQTLFRRDLDTIKARLEGAGPILEAGRGGSTMMRKQPLGAAVLDVLTAVPLFASAPLYRRWHLRWDTTDAEVRASMPGDKLVPQAAFNATCAITINAPPEQVWPWIVQMGYRRAGWYSTPCSTTLATRVLIPFCRRTSIRRSATGCRCPGESMRPRRSRCRASSATSGCSGRSRTAAGPGR